MKNYREFIEDIEKDKEIMKSFIPKDSLSLEIFNKTKNSYVIKEEIREKLLEITNAFLDFIGIDFFIYDIHFTGSLANYNWSNYSDLDIHILVDIDEFDSAKSNSIVFHEIIKEFFELKKKARKDFDFQLAQYRKTHENNKINSIERRLRNMKVKSVLSNDHLNKGMFFRAIVSNFTNPGALKDLLYTYRNCQFEKKYKSNSLNEMLYEFTLGGSLQELLRYSDRNSMVHSVEVRLPFLNHKLVEFVFSLPSSFKVNNGFSKFILRSSIDNKLPNEIVWRKDKIGYEPPNKSVIRGKALNKYLIDEIGL